MKISCSHLALSLLLCTAVTACSASHPATDASGTPTKTKAELKAEKAEAAEEAEAKKYPQPPANSPLAKIHRNMTEAEVRAILGPPTSSHSYQNGKQWIPYYGAFAPDVARTEYVYHGLGLVTFNQNRYNGGLFVLRVIYDPKR